MAIIIEGPDNSGKSTLAKVLSEKLNLPVVHAGGPPKTTEECIYRCQQDLVDMQKPIIMDRSFIISDTIYAPICRDGRLFDPRPWFRKILQLSLVDETINIIWCTAPSAVLMDMSTHVIKPTDTKEHLIKVEQNKYSLMRAYDRMYEVMSLYMDLVKCDPRQDTNDLVSLMQNLTGVKNENNNIH